MSQRRRKANRLGKKIQVGEFLYLAQNDVIEIKGQNVRTQHKK